MTASILDRARAFQDELTAIRRDIHAHPELGMEEHRTAELVAAKLQSWGIEVHRGIGHTGVVGVLRSGNGHGRVGLRADMDALPIKEAAGVAHASRHPGVMHACGHDGHTAMLLGAAKLLAETRDFNGTVHFIFQPAEEGRGGAEAMLKDRLFERFPCDSVFGLHNTPGLPIGKYQSGPGARMAGAAIFTIAITGKGAHGARPEQSIDPVMVACQLSMALQTIVSRNIAAQEPVVLSVTKIQSGEAFNVIPETASLAGTVRAFKRELMDKVREQMERLTTSIAAGFGAQANLDFQVLFPPTVNNDAEAEFFSDTAAALVGEDGINRNAPPVMGSEDFSFMLEKVPGAYMRLGNGDTAPVHNDRYDFNDAAIPYGVAVFAEAVARKLPKGR